MPAAFFVQIGLALANAAGQFLIVYSATLSTIALAVGTMAIGSYQRRKAQRAARDAYNANLQDRLVMTATVDGARSRVYGRVRQVDGVLFKATSGTNSEFYTLLVALAGHEIDAVESIYFGDELVTRDGNGWVQNAPWLQTQTISRVDNFTISGGSGSVTLPYTPVAGTAVVSMGYQENGGGEHVNLTPTVVGTQVSVTGFPANGTAAVTYQYLNPIKSFARVRTYLGTAAQDLSGDLVADFPSLCQATDKFKGIALLRLDLEYSQDAFPTGVPQVSAVIRGAKCYDPRSGLTVWTQNPAIIARDWVRYAYGGNTTSVSDTSITAAANVCDVDTTFVLPSGNVTMDTYQCGMVCKLDENPSAALSEIVESMAGRWGWSGGTLKLIAGAYRAPIDTITEDWISDATDVQITPTPPRSELVNAYRTTISNRDSKYQAEPAPPLIASAYVTADGQQLDAEITMAAVTSIAHAQHIAGVMLRDARQSLIVQLPCNFRAWKFELFDTVSVTLSRFGWSAKVFEIVGWRFALPSGVVLTLKETAASIYNPDAGFADLGNDDNTDLPSPWVVGQVTGVVVTSGTSTLVDGSLLTRTRVVWTPVADAAVRSSGRIEIQWAEAAGVGAEQWPGTMEAGSATETIIVGLRSAYLYRFRVRSVNSAGVRGPWSIMAAHVIAVPPAITGSVTYLQTTAPVTANAGDLWFDSDDGNAAYRYSGAAWVSVADSDLTAVTAAVNAISSDAVLSKGEKPQVVIDYTNAVNEYSTLIASANSYSIVTERDNYTTNYTALGSYLSGLSPAYNDTTTDTTIVAATYRTTWQNFYYNRQILLNQIAARAGQTATWTSIVGTGKPADFATQNVIYRQASDPGGNNGDTWIDTDAVPAQITYVKSGGVWREVSNSNWGSTSLWTGVTTRPTLYRVAASGFSSTSQPLVSGFYNGETTATLYTTGSMYRVLSINRSSGAIANIGTYNTYDTGVEGSAGGIAAANAMAAALNAIGSTHIVVVYSYDEPKTNRMQGNLPAAIYRCGGSKAVFGSPQFQNRGAYILIGIGGCGAGNGFEAYGGDTANSVDAWCDVSFYIYQSSLVISGTTKTPTTLADYGYVGTGDVFDFAGGGQLGTNFITRRTVLLTPTKNCRIQFAATIVADNVSPDAGQNLEWQVTPAGGSPITLGIGRPSSTAAAQTYSTIASFDAVGAVQLTFEIRTRAASALSVHLWESSMQITQVAT